jgi:hypothetical protein
MTLELLSPIDIKVIYLLFSVQNEDWVVNGEDPDGEFAEKISDLERHVSFNPLVPFMEFFYGGPGFSDVWLSRGELISDVLSEDPDLEDEINEDNRLWFMRLRKDAYEKLGVFQVIPGISMKRLIPVMRERGVI